MSTNPEVKPSQIELRCGKNSDATYSGVAYLDGQQLHPAADYGFNKGNCEDVKRVHDKLLKEFDGAVITVVGDCSECLS